MVAGAVFGGLTWSSDGEADEICADRARCVCVDGTCTGPDAQDAADLSEDAQLYATLANGLFFGGLAAAGLGVVLYFTAPEGPIRSGVVVPIIGPTASGVAVAGSF